MVLVAVWAVGFTAISTQAQVCSFGTGGGSTSGSGGATLTTISVDGNGSDWGTVLANTNQVTYDGEWVNCSESTDKDYVINPGPPASCATRSVSGRDLAVFAWTYDSTNVYLYVKRFGSSTNTQTFYFYMDTNSNQRMNTNEKVYQVQLSGSNRRTIGTLYNYTTVDGTNGDPLVAPTGSTYPGYADGYTVVGSLNLSNPVTIYSNLTGGFADGTGFEAYIPWTNIGVAAGTPIYFHVSSTNSSNPAQVPASIDDNLGGVNGQMGAFAFRGISITPDNSSAVTPANPTVVWYDHTVKNTGTLPDRYDLTTFSTLGLRVDLYLPDGTTLVATDSNGDGDFTDAGDYVNPSYLNSLSGRPQTPQLAAEGTFAVKVKITAPYGVEGVQDVTTLSAFSQGDTGICASGKDTTAIGDLALTPTPQSKSVVANQTVDYALKVGNYSLVDTFDLKVVSSLGWKVQIYTDPNGDGNPADGVLIATDVNGNGIYTDAGDTILPGYDTNSNSRPDFDAIANAGTVHFVVRLTAPSGAATGAVDACTVLAQGGTYGASASAVLTTTVRERLTFTPSYTVTGGTNKYSGQGRSVFYAHTLINSWPSPDTITLSSTSSPTGWTVRYWTDPNGDGNPGDGTQITGSFSLAANGGTLHLVVEVVIPTGLTLPLTHTATVTATGSASAPTVTDEVRVSYVSTFSDPNRTVSKRVFALCQTIYAQGSSLVANSTYSFRYINPSSVVIRTQSVQSDGNGEAIDQYTLASADVRGTWTVALLNSSNVVVDSLTVTVDPPTGTPSSVSPVTLGRASYALTGENLSSTATFNNTSAGADYAGTAYHYLVRTPNLAQYLRSDGVFASYSGSELTRSTSPHTVAASSSASETITVNGVQFPTAGIYRVDVTWVGSCGYTIATATVTVPVGTTLASFQDSAHTVPRDDFGSGATVYLAGTTYLASTSYTVAYYRPDGTLAFTHSVTSGAGGTLSDSAAVASLTTDGTWRAVVYQSTLSAPPVYNPGDATATSSDSFTVDTVSPSITVNTVSTTSTSPALSGTVSDPTATVQVIVNGNTYTAMNNGDGTWTLPAGTISPALAAGAYDVVAIATDPAGNTGTDTTTDELTVHFPAPVVTSPINAGATSVSGTSTAPAGTTITVYSNGTPIGTTTVQAGGVWTLTGVSGLVGGESITATAGTGAEQSAFSIPVVVTPSAPVINGPIIEGATLVSGTSTAPPGSTVTVTVNGVDYTTTVLGGGTWSVAVAALSGNDSVSATVLANGQTSSAATEIVHFAAPVVSGPINAGETTVSGTSTSPPGTTITVYRYSTPVGTTTVQPDGTWILNAVPGLTGGQLIRATAGTGSGESVQSNTVVVIPAPPVVSSPILQGSASVSGTSGAPVGSTIRVYKNGAFIGVTVVLSDGTWTLNGISPTLAAGDVIKATANAGGQTSGDSNLVTVQNEAPALSGPILAGASSITGTSTAPSGTTITVYSNGSPIGTTTVGAGGTWTLSGVSGLVGGESITATAGTGAAMSALSNAVVVTPSAPVINGPLVEGQTSVTGTSTAPPGSTITVTVGGVPYTTTVQPDGMWSVTVPALGGNESVSATVTTNGQTSSTTTTTVDFAAPTVGGPILAGASSISGTSTSPVGTTISVYSNGTPIGTTTVQAGGVWTLTGVSGLVGGESITATAGTGAAQSAVSNAVTVQANASLPPIVSSPILAGGAVPILGSSVEPPGSLITVYIDGVPVGTTTVQANGTWSYGPAALADGQVVSATVQAPGETVSPLSNTVTVATNSGDLTPAPIVAGPIPSGATSVSGTSVPGASVDVYADGVYLGTTLADGVGNWTLPSIGPLPDGAIVTATATLGPGGTSPWSGPVVVGTAVHLLRNDTLTAFSMYTPGLFPGHPGDPSLEVIGPNHVGNNGEGALQEFPGSSDDDFFYMRSVVSGTPDPDAAVLKDDGRPLVFYQLVDNGATTLHLNKSGEQLIITFAP